MHGAGTVCEDDVTFCERFLELITDLEAQLPTRRFFNTLLDSCSFVVSYILPLSPGCHVC